MLAAQSWLPDLGNYVVLPILINSLVWGLVLGSYAYDCAPLLVGIEVSCGRTKNQVGQQQILVDVLSWIRDSELANILSFAQVL
jgi:hypothetical protein